MIQKNSEAFRIAKQLNNLAHMACLIYRSKAYHFAEGMVQASSLNLRYFLRF